MSENCMTIAVTIGDPVGIGPEVVAKALADPHVASLANWIVLGSQQVMNRQPGWPPTSARVDLADMGQPGEDDWEVGAVNPACGRAALEYVRRATQMCIDGHATAMVTGPVNKEAVTLSGELFSGHTEFIAQQCKADSPRMLLVNDQLRVLHVTTHIPLREACQLTMGRVLQTIELGVTALQQLGVQQPRIGVCGLNPHAGENRMFGDEDDLVIAPAVAGACQTGIDCHGPLPADTVFHKAVRGAYDLVIAMYHDQGHIPIKLLDFENTVNVSLGLPIIRTSVDHGTGFDIAGKNQADPASMKQALRMAVRLAASQRDAHCTED